MQHPIAAPIEERESRSKADANLRRGIFRGRRQAGASGPSGDTQLTLSFIWPGLGQWHAAERRRALIYALPPLALILVLLGALLFAPQALFVQLLVPSFAAAVILLLALDLLWRLASMFDTWRTNRRQAATTRRTLPALVTFSVIVLVVHVVAASYVGLIGAAGSAIFQGDRPRGNSPLDLALGGPVVPDGSGATSTPGNTGDCPVVDPGDQTGYGDPADDPIGPDDTDPGDNPDLPPGPSFDPGVRPPPLVCNPNEEVPLGSPGTAGADGLITVLFVGIDSGLDRDHALTDTLMVASYDPASDRVTMISTPRDTGRFPLYTGGYYKNRINTFLNYAGHHPSQFPEGPIKALMREMGYIVGVQIDYFASTNLDGFPQLVDLVGGVDVVNPKRFLLQGNSATGDYLDPGPYHLDGAMARKYVRARHGLNNSDWQRARRQQQVIAALAERALNPDVAARLPQIIAAAADLARTSANPADLPSLLPILTRATAAAAEHIVLQPNTYARRIPPAEVNGRYMTELNIAAVREMSIRLFGQYSRYASGG